MSSLLRLLFDSCGSVPAVYGFMYEEMAHSIRERALMTPIVQWCSQHVTTEFETVRHAPPSRVLVMLLS